MTPAELQALLQEDEGGSLDFKREQYCFYGDSDDDKAELLKDILGFANNWRRADAFIVIGVEERRAGHHRVCGVSEHLRDNDLQQFINSKTNRPIRFSYETCDYMGLSVGVIRIAQQPRPFFLKKPFARLAADKVFLRRGSSTDPTRPASPDEIAMMGASTDTLVHPSLEILLGSDHKDEIFSPPVHVSSQVLQIPPREHIPARRDEGTRISLPSGKTFDIAPAPTRLYGDSLNTEYFRQRAEYEVFHKFFRVFRLLIRNSGTVTARNVVLELALPAAAGILVRDLEEAPPRPRRRESPLSKLDRLIAGSRPSPPIGGVSLDRERSTPILHVSCGDMQPGLPLWTEAFWLGLSGPEEVTWSGVLYADNLPYPLTVQIPFRGTTAYQTLTVENVLALPDLDEA